MQQLADWLKHLDMFEHAERLAGLNLCRGRLVL